MKPLDAILIDLDGTLTDPAPGIIGCFRFALTGMGFTPPEPHVLTWVIGPPLRDSFALLGVADPELGLRLYRSRYAVTGLLEATLYDHIPQMLADLQAITPRLILCTSKPHVYARPILDHFRLDRFFTAIYGAELDGTHDDKGDLIAHILAKEELNPARLIMIGDRRYDVQGAARHGIPTIGALWGFGGASELREAGAAALCATPEHVPQAVRACCAA